MINIFDKDITEISELIKNGSLSPIDLYNHYSNRIKKYENKISSFIDIYDDWEEKALIAEKQILNGELIGPLHGIPVAVKDLVDVKGIVTTAGSKILNDNIADFDAEIISALKKAGAIILGISKALIAHDENLKKSLKKDKLTTRDSRVVERKKYGHRKARRSFQFSKR